MEDSQIKELMEKYNFKMMCSLMYMDGSMHDFAILRVFDGEYRGAAKRYAALKPLESVGDPNVSMIVYGYEKVNGEDMIVNIDEDAEFNYAVDLLYRQLNEELLKGKS